MAAINDPVPPQATIAVHDDKYGNPIEAFVGKNSSRIEVHEQLSMPVGALENKSAQSNDRYSEEKAESLTTDIEPARIERTRVSYFRRIGRILRPSKLTVSIICWLLVTTWWVVGLVYHRDGQNGRVRYNWVQPFLLWVAVTIRIVTLFVPARLALIPFRFVWGHSVKQVEIIVPEKFRTIVGAFIVFAAILLGAFVPAEHVYNKRSDRAVSLFGYLVFLLGLYITSRHRHHINWRPVIVGLLVQFIIAIFVLRTTLGKDIFTFLSQALTTFLSFAYVGVAWLTDTVTSKSYWFVIGSLPVFIFFTAIVQMAYYVGLIQWVVPKCSYIFHWMLNISGVEAIVAVVTPFLGMGEAAILIKGFIPHMTQAEIHQVMTCGFATISGALMVVYIGLGANGQAVISSCLMSIPISIVISKMRVPETEEPLTTGHIAVINMDPEDGNKETGVLHALANGAWLGLRVAGMVLANILVIISLVALANGILHWTFKYIQAPNVTIEQICGYLFYPVAFLMGVPRDELYLVGQLLGMKSIQNEFVAFGALTSGAEFAHLSQRANLIATYGICGFANIGSIAILLGIYGQFSPERRGDFAKEAVSACICGALATFMSASLAGMLFSL